MVDVDSDNNDDNDDNEDDDDEYILNLEKIQLLLIN